MTGRGNDCLVWAALLFALAAGVTIGWGACTNATDIRYVRALAEQHEATKRYWDMHTNDILVNNTLRLRSGDTERTKQDAKH